MLLILSSAPKTQSAEKTLYKISESLENNNTAHKVCYFEDVRLVLQKSVVNIFIGWCLKISTTSISR